MQSNLNSKKSNFLADINPKYWLRNYRETGFIYISLMFLFYSVIGLVAASTVESIQNYAFDYEEPGPPISFLQAVLAGPFEETLFFGLPFALSGNIYAVLISGAIWSSIHLLNTGELIFDGFFSTSTFAFTITHIFFSLRAWKSGKGWYAVILHSSWNAVFVGIAMAIGEMSLIIYDDTQLGRITEIVSVILVGILVAVTYPLYKRRMRIESAKKWIVGSFEYTKRSRSWWWLSLPILFGLIGSLISFFAIRHDDPKKARICLYVGIAVFVLSFGWGFTSNMFYENELQIPDIQKGIKSVEFENANDLLDFDYTGTITQPSKSFNSDLSELFPEPSNANWSVEKRKDFSDSKFGWGIQQKEERFYYNYEQPIIVKISINEIDSKENAVIFYEYEKSLFSDAEPPLPEGYDSLNYDKDAVMSINADNCHAYKMGQPNGNNTKFSVNCQKDSFFYQIFTDTWGMILPENIAIDFANEIAVNIPE